MKKRMLSVLLCAAMAAGTLAGCGGKEEAPAASSAPASQAEEQASSGGAEKEIVTIKVAHNKDYVTVPEAVLEAGKRLNEKYAAEGKNI